MGPDLQGRVAAVAAASQGLGYGAARALALAGARVGICARAKQRLDEAARRLRDETGAEVVPVAADLSRPGQAAGFVKETLAAFSTDRLDVLVNNGGGPKPALAEALSDADWQGAFELLLLNNVRACRAALPHMQAHGGSIVNIVSTSVKHPIDGLVLSTSLRSAVVGFAKTLSLEWARYGIRVNNVCPGSMQTQRIDEVVRSQATREGVPFEEARRRREASVPLGRFGTADELGAVVAFLASSEAAYVTGQTLSVDGGATRWVHG